MVKFISTRPYSGVNGKYHSPYMQAKNYATKLKAYFIDVKCAELTIDSIGCLSTMFSQCYNIMMQVVIYLECYHKCNCKICEFIDAYFKRDDFPRKIIVIAGDLAE